MRNIKYGRRSPWYEIDNGLSLVRLALHQRVIPQIVYLLGWGIHFWSYFPVFRSFTRWYMFFVWAWAHGDVGEAVYQQCANNKLLDVTERVSAHQLPLRPGSAPGWLVAHSECMRWDLWHLSMDFRFRTHKLCPLGASLLEGHGAVTRDPPISPWGVYGRVVRRARWRQEVFTDDPWPEPRAQHPVSEGR